MLPILPEARAIQGSNLGPVIGISKVGELHHHYECHQETAADLLYGILAKDSWKTIRA